MGRALLVPKTRNGISESKPSAAYGMSHFPGHFETSMMPMTFISDRAVGRNGTSGVCPTCSPKHSRNRGGAFSTVSHGGG